MTQPLLSICIPTYNRANYLDNCLDSLKTQLQGNNELLDLVEIVISDNCSADNTLHVAGSYKKYFPKFIYTVNTANVGFDLNVVNVVKKATGKFCWYLGDDDTVMNGGIDFVIEQLKTNYFDVVTVEVEPDYGTERYKVRKKYNISEAVVVSDFNDFYFRGYCQGGFSVLIFNREKWLLSLNTQSFLQHWLYYETVIKMLTIVDKKMLYIRQPVIYTGQDCRWAENGTELFTFVNACILVDKMIGFGYDKVKAKSEIAKNNSSTILMLLRAKGHGLKCNVQNLQYIFKNLKGLGIFRSLAVLLIYIIPNSMVRAIRDMRKTMTKHRKI